MEKRSSNFNLEKLESAEDTQHLASSLNTTIHSAMHDLRSPLNVIKPYVDFLKKIDDSEKQEAILDRMKNAVEKMEVLINKFVKYSDLICESNPAVETILFKDIFQQVCRDIKYQYLHVEHDIKLLDESQDSPFSFPPKYLTLILRILLDNSFKYRSPERSLKVQISVSVIHDDLMIEMKDNGMGFPECFSFEEAFVPFAKNASPSRGAGLGLASLRYMIQKNRGEVYGQSSADGTAFIIKLKPYPVFNSDHPHQSSTTDKDLEYKDRLGITMVS